MQLASTEEYIDGQFTGNLGEVLIRYIYVMVVVVVVHMTRCAWQ